MAEREIVILLLGPTRSGKTKFATEASKQANKDGDGVSTLKCKDYSFRAYGRRFKIIDTPGLDDSPNANMEVLRQIAVYLKGMGSAAAVNGIIYFYRITDGRLSGSARSSIKLFELICGEAFFSRAVFLTTMWDTVSNDGRTKYTGLANDLRARHSHMTNRGARFLRLNYRGNQAEEEGGPDEVLKHFINLKPQESHELLKLADDVKRLGATASGVRRSAAGKYILRLPRQRANACPIL